MNWGCLVKQKPTRWCGHDIDSPLESWIENAGQPIQPVSLIHNPRVSRHATTVRIRARPHIQPGFVSRAGRKVGRCLSRFLLLVWVRKGKTWSIRNKPGGCRRPFVQPFTSSVHAKGALFGFYYVRSNSLFLAHVVCRCSCPAASDLSSEWTENTLLQAAVSCGEGGSMRCRDVDCASDKGIKLLFTQDRLLSRLAHGMGCAPSIYGIPQSLAYAGEKSHKPTGKGAAKEQLIMAHCVSSRWACPSLTSPNMHTKCHTSFLVLPSSMTAQ
jgi:hypothetical protein